MARCQTCGAALLDPTERFCGGDRCLRVWVPRGDARHAAGAMVAGPRVVRAGLVR
jgi:hypothetical protein